MDTRDAPSAAQPGLDETAAAWARAGDPLRARPTTRPLDVSRLVDDMHERFPIIMARLAE